MNKGGTSYPLSAINLAGKALPLSLTISLSLSLSDFVLFLVQEGFSWAELVVVSLNTEEVRRGGGGASRLCLPESEDKASWWCGGWWRRCLDLDLGLGLIFSRFSDFFASV